MTTWTRRLSPLAAVSLLLIPTAAGAHDIGDLADSGTAAIATQEERLEVEDSFAVLRDDDGTVDTSNVAYAYAEQCTGCDAIAFSFQVVLANGATEVRPENWAVAWNQECTDCTTAAFARQFVVAREQVWLTEAGEERLEEVEERLEALVEGVEEDLEDRREAGGTKLSLAELQAIEAEVNALADEVRTILSEELVDTPDDDDTSDDDDDIQEHEADDLG